MCVCVCVGISSGFPLCSPRSPGGGYPVVSLGLNLSTIMLDQLLDQFSVGCCVCVFARRSCCVMSHTLSLLSLPPSPLSVGDCGSDEVLFSFSLLTVFCLDVCV